MACLLCERTLGALTKRGWTPDEIARELDLPVVEVAVVLSSRAERLERQRVREMRPLCESCRSISPIKGEDLCSRCLGRALRIACYELWLAGWTFRQIGEALDRSMERARTQAYARILELAGRHQKAVLSSESWARRLRTAGALVGNWKTALAIFDGSIQLPPEDADA